MIFLRLFPFLTVLAVFAFDRATKHAIKAGFAYGEPRAVLPFFNLTYLENTGAAFGIGQNLNRFFIGSSIVILIALFVLARKAAGDSVKVKTALSLIVGGALGNLYDRITQGSVTDFLDFYIGAHHWPAFNVADSSIFIGACLLAVMQWRSKEVKPA